MCDKSIEYFLVVEQKQRLKQDQLTLIIGLG